MLFLDSSVLIDALTGPRTGWHRLAALVDRGERIAISALVLYEWLRRERTQVELETFHTLVPEARIVPFEHIQAALSANYYRSLPRGRARSLDFGIAACAVIHDLPLWTYNRADFADIPGLRLFAPAL